MTVTDTAIIVVNNQFGPEVGTQNHFRYTEKLGKPVIFLLNQLDAEKSDYNQSVERLRELFGSKVVQIQYTTSVADRQYVFQKNIHILFNFLS